MLDINRPVVELDHAHRVEFSNIAIQVIFVVVGEEDAEILGTLETACGQRLLFRATDYKFMI